VNERRIARLQEQIKERLAQILQRDLADPRLGLVTITRVELDSEFTQCKAYWSVFAPTAAGEARARAQSAEVLARARGLCQREMGRTLNTRTVPHLEFVHDEGIAEAARVNKLLRELQQEREQREAAAPGPVEAPPGAVPGGVPPGEVSGGGPPAEPPRPGDA
jgi:ribosome-binding factor A